MGDTTSNAEKLNYQELIVAALNNGANNVASLCNDFGLATNCSASSISGAIINKRQSDWEITKNEICGDIAKGTPMDQALKTAGLDGGTNLQCTPSASPATAIKTPALVK